DAAPVRQDPYLQKVQRLAGGTVELAVLNAAARAHALHVAGANGGTVAHRVLVRQCAGQHIAEDFHVAVGMGTEACALLYPALVDHAQRTEIHLLRIEVIREREGVIRLEPAMIGIATFGTAPDFLHAASEAQARQMGAAGRNTSPSGPAPARL